jgi:hypothetical protein
MRAAHQGAEGYVVEFGFGVEAARLREHNGKHRSNDVTK